MSQPYDRVYNFSAGPCTLPVPVLERVRDELVNWQGSGMSVMEMSHRGKHFEGILADAERSFRDLLGVPESYKVLFLQGGASMQNTLIPLNLCPPGATADYVVTGTWGKKSAEAACIAGCGNTVFDGKATNYDRVPDLCSFPNTDRAAYIHFTSNETIQGVEFQGDFDLPAPAVCDVSSNILSRPMDVAKYALLYAGAQKNMGPAGVTVIVIRDDMIARVPANLQPMLDYRLHAENDSMYNTPPCFAIYVCGLVYRWVREQGGLEVMQARNRAKANRLYAAIDESDGFYAGHAQSGCRSVMNVTFRLPNDEITDRFLKGAVAHKLDGLKGHRSVGGIRASIYNAFPEEGCETLAGYMRDFSAKNA